jgi:hypothetical protein
MSLISSHQAEPSGRRERLVPGANSFGPEAEASAYAIYRYVLRKTLAVVIQFEVIRWPLE